MRKPALDRLLEAAIARALGLDAPRADTARRARPARPQRAPKAA